MKITIMLVILLSSLITIAQKSDSSFNGDTWISPYTLKLPKGWGYERFLLPPDFATNIKYKGVEDLRFAPDWTTETSIYYWTYAYLWYLEKRVLINKQNLLKVLKTYYDGLIERNIKKRNIPTNKTIPTTLVLKQIKTHLGDKKTFSGKINILDYMKQAPITLNCIIHYKYCIETDKTFLFFQISPKSFSSKNWSILNDIWSQFICSKNIQIN